MSYQRKRLKDAARSTVDREICYVLRVLRLNGFHVRRPSPKPGKFVPNRAFSSEELTRLFKNVTACFRTVYATLLVSGARLAELVPSEASTHKPLLKTEVDLEKRCLTIRSAKVRGGKAAKARVIGIPEEIVPLLANQMRETEGPFVFDKLHNAARDFDAALDRAEISKLDALGSKLTLHSFRHTYATLMAESIGHNPFVLKEILGHRRITTTEQYCHPRAPVLAVPLPPMG